MAPLFTACLAFSLQVLISSGLLDPQTPQGGLSTQLPQAGLNTDDSPFEGGKGDVKTKNTIKIGLLIQNETSVAAKNGAELAILNANSKDDKGIKFELIVRSMEGPWGTGSREAVSMIFDQNVIGILGSHDGRNAHLVEQVAAKSRVVFISAWTSDPTLSEAFVPWFFNCVPTDLQQASSLTAEIYGKRKLSRIAVISDYSYDSQSALNNFIKVAAGENRPQPLKFIADSATSNQDLGARLKRADIQGIVLFVHPPLSAKIAEGLKLQHVDLPVFGTVALMDENKISLQEMKNYESFIIVSAGTPTGNEDLSFREDYKKAYGISPGPVAGFAFDGMNLLIEAIRKSGSGYEKIQKTLTEIRYNGVTGTIRFDDKGNRKGNTGFVEIKNGIPVSLK